MASITDYVVEGLKYPFNDIKKLLGFGGLFALISAISVFTSVKSLDVFKDSVHIINGTNGAFPHFSVSQLPAGDIYLLVGLSIVSFIISLFILGYQYDIVKFSIEKKEDLPGFGNILAMLIKGIKYFIVTLAYNIIPLLILSCGILFASNSSLLIVIILISVLLFIIAYFLQIMALNNMVAYDSLKKAFDFREIIGNIANLGWVKYIGIIIFTIIVYAIIMIAVNIILGYITTIFAMTISNQALVISFVVAIIEGLFINSYGTIFFSRVCGSIYRESIK